MADVHTDDGGSWAKAGGAGGRHFVTRQIAGETLVIPIAGQVGDLDAIYTLNEVAASVWELIDGPTPVSQIVESLGREYDVTPEQARADVLELLAALEAKGLIQSTRNDVS